MQVHSTCNVGCRAILISPVIHTVECDAVDACAVKKFHLHTEYFPATRVEMLRNGSLERLVPKGICGGGWVSSVLISVLFLIHGKAPSIKNHLKYIGYTWEVQVLLTI